MADKMSLPALGLTSARDLCVLDPNPPPLNFEDLNLPEPVASRPQPAAMPDMYTYWGPA